MSLPNTNNIIPANTTPKPTVGSLVTGRSVCNDASADCKSVARAVVADQAALEARKKSRQSKARQANATAGAGDDEEEEEGAGETNDKRSKNLFQTEARAAVADPAALDARQKSRQAKARQANATAGAGDDEEEEEGAGETNDKRSKNLFETEARAVVADKAALDARQKSRQAKARQANATAPAGDDDDEEEGAEGAGETNDKRSKNLFQAEAATLKTRDGNSRRSHQLW